ncbi:hypothetical protein VdG1_09284 [Verticillium dahliae VDG1]|nr:hypothetical protein VdG1_09284 [Verticillium dahliae VDG1]
MTPPPAAAGTMDDRTSLTAISSQIEADSSSSSSAAAATAAADTNTKPLPAPTLDAGKQTAPVRQCHCRSKAKSE